MKMYEQVMRLNEQGEQPPLNQYNQQVNDTFINTRGMANPMLRVENLAKQRPIFDEFGALIQPGRDGGEYDPLRDFENIKKNQFNPAGQMSNTLQNQDIIRYNIEQLGGLQPTINSTLLLSDCRYAQYPAF